MVSFADVKRCSVGQRHDSDVVLFKDGRTAMDVVKKIYMRSGMILSHKDDARGGVVIVPCRTKHDFDSCDYKKPLTEGQLKLWSPTAYNLYMQSKVKPKLSVGGVDFESGDWAHQAAETMVTDLFRPTIYQPIHGLKPGGEVPEHYKQDTEVARKWVQADRIAQRYEKGQEGMATLSEAWIYLHGTTYSQPFFDKDMHKIYMYLGGLTLKRAGADISGQLESNGGILPDKLTKKQTDMLDGFRRWLYEESISRMKK